MFGILMACMHVREPKAIYILAINLHRAWSIYVHWPCPGEVAIYVKNSTMVRYYQVRSSASVFVKAEREDIDVSAC